MVVDTSAMLAILLDEPERRSFNEIIEDADDPLMSAATFVEVSIAIDARHGGDGIQDLDELIDRAGIDLVPVDVAQAREARRAWSRYGKGRHAAGLNHGDCFSYALAKTSGRSLLFKGDDFAETDIPAAFTHPETSRPEEADP